MVRARDMAHLTLTALKAQFCPELNWSGRGSISSRVVLTVDTCSRTVESLLTAALRAAHPKIEVFAVDTDGRPAESWAAEHIRFVITLPLSEQTAGAMAESFIVAGAEDVTVSETLATMPIVGTYARQRRMQRITGSLPDSAAQSLTTISFEIDPQEQEALERSWKRAVAAEDRDLEATGKKRPAPQATCQNMQCGVEFTPKPGTTAKYCSQLCFRAARREKAAARSK